MQAFEYKAIPAPGRGKKARGVKSTEDRFALAITDALNTMAADGWDYVRAETLPCEGRKGLTGTQTTDQHILIFRRRARDSAAGTPPLTLGQTTPSRREPAISRPQQVAETPAENS